MTTVFKARFKHFDVYSGRLLLPGDTIETDRKMLVKYPGTFEYVSGDTPEEPKKPEAPSPEAAGEDDKAPPQTPGKKHKKPVEPTAPPQPPETP